jgi:streptomycin 6-kinase
MHEWARRRPEFPTQRPGAKIPGMINSIVDPYLHRWSVNPDGPVTETPSSWLMPVRRGSSPAMLKVLKHSSDERNAAALLRYWDGDGAVRLYEEDENAVLLERANGSRSLMAMALSGGDTQAAEILAETVARLYARRASNIPLRLTPLPEWFSSLYAHETVTPLLGHCAAVARGLLATERDIVPLHGDLHHDNVLDGGERGWLAVDPKALIGERTYEVANLLGNPFPYGDIVHSPDRMQRLAQLYAARLGLPVERVLAFALAHAGLSASWHIEEDRDPAYRLRCADILSPLVDAS